MVNVTVVKGKRLIDEDAKKTGSCSGVMSTSSSVKGVWLNKCFLLEALRHRNSVFLGFNARRLAAIHSVVQVDFVRSVFFLI